MKIKPMIAKLGKKEKYLGFKKKKRNNGKSSCKNTGRRKRTT